MEKNEKRLTVNVPPAVFAALERKALAEQRPVANLVRKIVIEALPEVKPDLARTNDSL